MPLKLEFKRRPDDAWEPYMHPIATHLDGMLRGLAICERWPAAVFRILFLPDQLGGGLSSAAIASTNGNDSATIQKCEV
jgi:hypothetical protein